ncbi:DUF2637 domain-containing protein [Streptosporangium sandarakinum]|uniref:DUF2637 domain-containing protein n=1 Tax=Streptosporangium sandarakinum TaxID=1260955 RepID=A0A852UX95_9ACTN|nr:DUF2637 domain-containing protein [Streptosporangium sandarakinum]NYF40236.1 hypothetical protein [Streptosporangium sandarakinum]
MDVKPPAAADPVSRPSAPLPAPARPSRTAIVLRRAGIALAGICVAALTAAACVLSFEDLRALAVTGEADPGLAYLYPAAFDALLVIAMTAALLLWNGRWPARLQAGLVLALLLAAASAAEVTTAMRAPVDVRQAAVGVAVAPWVMVLLALWLWFLLIKHGAGRRTASGPGTAGRNGHGGYTGGTGDEAGWRDRGDIVPFPDAASGPVAGTSSPGGASGPIADGPSATASTRSPSATPYAAPTDATDDTADGTADGDRPRAARPVERAPHTPPGEPVHHAPVETPLDPQAAPPLESAPHHDLPPAVPLVGPTPAPETPEVDELPPTGDPDPDPVPARPTAPEAPTGSRPSTGFEPSGSEDSTAPEPTVEPPVVRESSETPPAPEPTAAPTPGRPVRWGDLLRPSKGDVLVHPLRPAAPEAGAAGQEADERGADTQPMLAIPDKDESGDEERDPAGRSGAAGSVPDPDPAHSAETADPGEGSADGGSATAPPPSGRMRSTPTPPDE